MLIRDPERALPLVLANYLPRGATGLAIVALLSGFVLLHRWRSALWCLVLVCVRNCALRAAVPEGSASAEFEII